MNSLTPPLQFLILAFGGYINRQQQDVIDYLPEENRVLREHLPKRRLLLTEFTGRLPPIDVPQLDSPGSDRVGLAALDTALGVATITLRR